MSFGTEQTRVYTKKYNFVLDGVTSAPPYEYDWSICAAVAILPVIVITVATGFSCW